MGKSLTLLLVVLLLVPLQLGVLSYSEEHHEVVSLDPNWYLYFPMVVAPNGVFVLMASSSPLTFMVMTPSQFQQFHSTGRGGSVYFKVSSSTDEYIPLSPGTYYLVFYNNVSGSRVHFTYFAFSRPAPTGIADLGLQYTDGRLLPYTEQFQGVIGVVKFNGPQRGYSEGGSSGTTGNSFSVQLNDVLVIKYKGGTQYLWAQNVIQYFDGDTTRFVDNVWNMTSRHASVSSGAVKGKGGIYPHYRDGVVEMYYAYSTPQLRAPPSVELVILARQLSENAVLIQFGYALGNENFTFGPVHWYDNVTVRVGGPVTSAAFVVNGSSVTGDNHALDSELVLGGECCELQANFARANVSLYMLYFNATPRGFEVFYPKALFPFGLDTAEGAYNLQTSGNGLVTVGLSAPPYVAPPVLPLGV
ncbi:MAG: thermopsin family protease [Thermoprotei archaeon]